VYFTADNSAEDKLQKRFSKILAVLTNAGVLAMSNLLTDSTSGFSSQDLEKIDQSGEGLLEKMDALIIEGTKPLPESGYYIAIALAHKKPILYLSDKNKTINQTLFQLRKDGNATGLLKLEYYTDASLEKIVMDFLQEVGRGDSRQNPTIKFTLRITPRIERYLYWRTHNTKISKADFLREMIEKLIDDDQGYLKDVNKHKD
jgi:predicted DNA-binding protein